MATGSRMLICPHKVKKWSLNKGVPGMAFENLMAQISLLVTQMENQPEDKHELYLQLRERLNEIRTTGMPLPEDLVRLEEELEAEFTGQAPSQ